MHRTSHPQTAFLPSLRNAASLLDFAAVVVVATLVLGLVAWLRLVQDVPIHVMTSDVTSMAGVPAYTGFVSQLGILFWAAAAALCLFCAAIARGRAGGEQARFFLASGLLTLVLALDDLFLLHESAFPHLGVPEKLVFASYGAFALYYLLRFRRIILATEFLMLATAFAFFGLSVALDVLNPPGINPYLLEDGTKLVGVLAWLAYFARTAAASLHYRPLEALGEARPVLVDVIRAGPRHTASRA